MLNCQSLGPEFKEDEGRLVNLVVACSTANHWVLGTKKDEGRLVSLVVAGWTANLLGPGFKEDEERLVSLMVMLNCKSLGPGYNNKKMMKGG